MKRICFLIGFTPNPRIKKRIEALKDSFSINLIYLNKGNEFLLGNIMPNVRSNEILIKNKNRDLCARIKDFVYIYIRAKKELKRDRPQYIYVQNLDMLIIARSYARRRQNVHLICEIADISPILTDEQQGFLRRLLQFVLRKCDKYYLRHVDLLVYTSRRFYARYYYKYIARKKSMYFPNMPDLEFFRNYRKENHKVFTVGFVGMIRFKKQMKMLVRASQNLRMRCLFAGSEIDEDNGISIKEMCDKLDGIKYMGKYNYETDICNIYSSLDAIYSVYDTSQLDICMALPNKLYEAIYCELPIIVSENTYLSEVVEKWKIGVSVSDKSVKDLEMVLSRLRDDKEYYYRIVSNCKRLKNNININKYNDELIKRIESI